MTGSLTPISQLPPAAPLTGVEQVPIVQNQETVRASVGAIRQFSSTQQSFAPVNLSIAASVGANALTISIKGDNGSDPSPDNLVLVPTRDPTGTASGIVSWLSITAAMSLTIPSGATLGTTNGNPFRFWLVGINDAGTFRLGVINCLGSNSIYPLGQNQMSLVFNSTTISAGSDSAQVIYAGIGTTFKPYTILGLLEYSAGLASAGAYVSVPTALQVFKEGIPTPGQPVQELPWLNSVSGGITSSTSYVDVAGTSVSVSLTKAMNAVKYLYTFQGQAASVAATNTTASFQVVRSATALNTTTIGSSVSGGGTGVTTGVAIGGVDFPATLSATTYKLQHLASASSTTTTSNINLQLQEIQV